MGIKKGAGRAKNKEVGGGISGGRANTYRD